MSPKKKPAKKPAKKSAKKPIKKPAKKPTKKPAKPESKVAASSVPDASNDEPFTIEEDGLVDIRLELIFADDAKVRVTPELAKRIMDGEFDGEDLTNIPGVDFDDILNTIRIEVDSAYEGRPPMTTRSKPPKSSPVASDAGDLPFGEEGGYVVEEDDDDGESDDDFVPLGDD
jgi:hypothetical protein